MTESKKIVVKNEHWCGGGIYGFAFLGAVVYYIQHATGFWDGVLGILKAIIWPAMLLYKVMEQLQMH